ncbi:acetate kinase [Kibdelosporangium banguiense]|uniref:Acetate kinase n=1 Tax=Kibdelosporangium banguiense TaxID=1365924 RepID=A0ABS4TPC7_9PSEU|nr:acetate/propionate family kinase [Kibdelosporangium banguiense]MBP2325766.1 acetate kinase [Kibdelosporangium banguiense]
MTVVLTVNPGSSSLQVHVVQTDGDKILAVEKTEEKADQAAAAKTLDTLLGEIDTPIAAVGHRLVHGGPHIRSPSVLTESVIDQARIAAELAPAHVPVTLELLEVARERLPDVPHVLCPDTGFHSDMPELATKYALPEEWRRDFGIRRYGFHGLSYAWATERAAQLLHRPADSVNLLLAHLGGGSSVCAVQGGSSVDTSMGFTPLEGVPMSTRSGSVDPGLLLWLLDRTSLTDVAEGLYHRSGLLGLSDGRSGDTRELVKAAYDGDSVARCAMDIFTRRISQALAAMAVNLKRVDALVFTGEIGWDQPEVRQAVCQDLGRLGIPAGLPVQNPTTDSILSSPYAPVLVLAVEPREELQIARETAVAVQVLNG